MRNPRLTGRKESVYAVKLDDGSIIKATHNHKFCLKSGGYKQVEELASGDSLYIITKFEASIKDIFADANSRSKDYWWLNNGQRNNKAEHRLIAAFHHNAKISKGHIVHHKDRDAQNNNPNNLEIITKRAHDILHAKFMKGDNNPMRRAKKEWNDKKWAVYRNKHSVNNWGEKNSNFSGVTHQELKEHALVLTKNLGRRFSHQDWLSYAKENNLPQHFSKWRRDHLGGIMGLAKWAAHKAGLEYIKADSRVIKSYSNYTALGYNCEIIAGRLLIVKKCEGCGKEFKVPAARREFGACSISCGLSKKWQDEKFRKDILKSINTAHKKRSADLREKQTKIYSDLRFNLERDPLKVEWIKACKQNGISAEISRDSSPFRRYDDLNEAALTHNHKVVSVEFVGHENVYNGTVDEFHNFFIGGFEAETKNNKRKFVYLNNSQCGEIVLRNRQFCNLSEVVCRAEDTEESLLRKVRIATILGTYQSSLTDFKYLSKEWKQNCEEERLLGVSLTGQWDCRIVRNPKFLKKLRDEAQRVNQEYAKRMGINPSTAITCVKPSGTVSQLVDSASGMHARHSKYYIRRVRIAATDPLFHMLRDQKFPYTPEVGQNLNSATTYVLEFPVEGPKGAITRDDLSSLDQLEYWKVVKENFTEHNPSVTVSIGEEEWVRTANWLYDNWNILGGLSFLPREEHAYALAPYEEITEERYNELVSQMPNIDFSQIVGYEKDDHTQGAKELACVAGLCEIEEIATKDTHPEKNSEA